LSASGRRHRERGTADGVINSGPVGRQEELDLLLEQVARLEAGAGSIAYIVGEAGLGKSRLVSEMLAKEVVRVASVLEGRATSIGRNATVKSFR